jgi:hypothetical protein
VGIDGIGGVEDEYAEVFEGDPSDFLSVALDDERAKRNGEVVVLP